MTHQVRHSEPNVEVRYAGVRENSLSIHMRVESRLGFGIMQQRHRSLQTAKEQDCLIVIGAPSQRPHYGHLSV